MTLAILLVLVAIGVVLFAIGTDVMRIRERLEGYGDGGIREAEEHLRQAISGNVELLEPGEASDNSTADGDTSTGASRL